MNIRSIARKPFYDIFHLNPIMSQLLRLAMSDSLSYDPINKIGGPFNNFAFSKFKKANSGLGVILNKLSHILR
jgi:hypothetical protein